MSNRARLLELLDKIDSEMEIRKERQEVVDEAERKLEDATPI